MRPKNVWKPSAGRLTIIVLVLLLAGGCVDQRVETPAPTPTVRAEPAALSTQPAASPTPVPQPTEVPPQPTPTPPPATAAAAPTEPESAATPTPTRQPVLQEYAVPDGAHPHDVAPAPDGSVWYTAQHQGALGRLDPETGATRHIPLGAGSAPHGVIVGPDGAPWVTDSGLNAIVRVDPASEEVQVFPQRSRCSRCRPPAAGPI